MHSGIRDIDFIRGRVPMTKEEIRILSLAKLGITGSSVVYDVGAGTGSIAIEAALVACGGVVYAVEKNPEAVSLIHANREKFGVVNLKVIEGRAPECLNQLPAPTHVMIGGSGGLLEEIVAYIREKNPNARFVVNAVTLETVSALQRISRDYSRYADMDLIQVGISRSRLMGEHHLMLAENPVYIAAFGGEEAGR